VEHSETFSEFLARMAVLISKGVMMYRSYPVELVGEFQREDEDRVINIAQLLESKGI
jgi:hypothetical protein